MHPMRDTIKKHEDFLMRDSDPSVRATYFFIRAKRARFPGNPRVGFTSTKRTFRLAVDRNRSKRLLRDWVRFNEHLLYEGFDYVFIARPGILYVERDAGRVMMAKTLKYMMHVYVPKEKQKFSKHS